MGCAQVLRLQLRSFSRYCLLNGQTVVSTLAAAILEPPRAPALEF